MLLREVEAGEDLLPIRFYAGLDVNACEKMSAQDQLRALTECVGRAAQKLEGLRRVVDVLAPREKKGATEEPNVLPSLSESASRVIERALAKEEHVIPEIIISMNTAHTEQGVFIRLGQPIQNVVQEALRIAGEPKKED